MFLREQDRTVHVVQDVENSLVVAIERDDRVLTPHGTTPIREDDLVTVLCPGGDTDRMLDAFVAEELLE